MPQSGLPLIDYIVIIFYLLLMLGIGFYFSRFMKGGKEFFIGGNLIPWWVAGISLYMTTFSAWMFTGAASFTYNTGWFGILFFVVKPIGFFIGFQISAWRWRRTRVTSPVEYVKSRFNKTTHLFLSIMLMISMMYWPGHHLASLSKICAPTLFPNSMAAIDIMIVASGILILIYTIAGGLWAVCVTDVVQFLILFCICLVLIPACFLSGDLGSVSDFLQKIPPLKFNHVIRETTVYNQWYLVGFLVAGIFGNAVGDKAQRFYSVKDEKAAKKVGWLAFVLFLTGPILFGVPPLVGKVLWPEISQLSYFSNITKPDENIFIAVVMKYLPAGLVGIFLSAMMAASMSALDSVWNTVSSIFSIDIYKNFFRPSAEEKELLIVGRVTIVFLCLIAICMALLIIHSGLGIFTISNIVLGLVGIPVTIPLLVGIVSKNISRWSAVSSIFAGILMAAVARFCLNYSLGSQYILTIFVSLVFIFSSNPLGKCYLRNKKITLLISLSVGFLFWIFFATFNNSGVSLSNFSLSVIKHLLLLFSAILFSGLLFGFSKLYARDLLSSQTEVEKFFLKLETPIDVKKEVLGKEEKNIYFLVGAVAMSLSLFSLLLLLVPIGRTSLWVNITFSLLLFVFGFFMFVSKKVRVF